MAGCSPIVDARGHVEDEPMEKRILPQTTTQDDVLRQYGSPSSISTFGPEVWYYISSRKERQAFFKPKIVDQRVTEIEFGGDGVVKEVRAYDMKDGKRIDVVEGTTPTEGHKLGFVEQVLGNLGRFNKPKDAAGD